MLRIFLFFCMLLLWSGCFLSFTPKAEQNKSVWKNLPPIKASNQSKDVVKLRSDCDKVATLAQSQIGTRYRYGGMSESGFDCSGFVCYVYQNALGKKLPHSALKQSRYVKIYDLEELDKGDLVFFDTSGRGKINHCGIYLGEGKFIHASSGKVYSVTTSDLTKGFYKKAFRWGGKVHKW